VPSVVRLAVAALAVAAAGVVVPAPAQAATCGSSSGVSVVVDFHQLGGGVQSVCDAGGAGKFADVQFTESGFALSYVNGEPFVCRVDQLPDSACARTPPANAYWSLWWSDGKSGSWSYSSGGVKALKVPAGGYVALSWQGQSSQAKPRVAPTAHSSSSPSSSPTSRPPSSGSPTKAPTHAPSSNAPAAPPTSTATTGPTAGSTSGPRGAEKSKASHGAANHHRTASPPAAATAQAQAPVAQVASGNPQGPGGSGGLPGWVAPVAIVVLFAGAGGFALIRRKTRGGA